MMANDFIGKVLRVPILFFGFASKPLSVIIRDLNRPVGFRVSPRTDRAGFFAPTALRTLGIVTLLTQWLKVFFCINPVRWSAISTSWRFMVRGKLDLWFLSSAICASVSKLVLNLFPNCWVRGGSWDTLGFNVQSLHLITNAFLPDPRKSFFSLKFTHASKYILVRYLPSICPLLINATANFLLGYLWTRYSMALWPKYIQKPFINYSVCGCGADEFCHGIFKPLFAVTVGMGWGFSWNNKQPLTGTRLDQENNLPLCLSGSEILSWT